MDAEEIKALFGSTERLGPDLMQGNMTVMCNVELLCVRCEGKGLRADLRIMLRRYADGRLVVTGEAFCEQCWEVMRNGAIDLTTDGGDGE